jgi:hypothetical protein
MSLHRARSFTQLILERWKLWASICAQGMTVNEPIFTKIKLAQQIFLKVSLKVVFVLEAPAAIFCRCFGNVYFSTFTNQHGQ